MLSRVKKLSSVDQLFAILRIITIIGGISWVFLTPLSQSAQTALIFTFGFFCAYSIILYLLIFLTSLQIKTVYYIALFLDLLFLYLLVRLTGGIQSDFELAFLLLIALHAFYFGLSVGIAVAATSSFVYLLAGNFQIDTSEWTNVALRTAFFFLGGVTMGLLSRKERIDRQRIQNLNKDLIQEKEKISKILQGINAGLVLLNTDRKIIWMNKISEEWFSSLEDVQGKKCHAAFWNDHRFCDDCPTARCLKTGKIESGEIEFSRKNDEVHYYRITSAPLPNENGKIDRILELYQDITEEKELQLHLIQSSKLAAVGELASGTAHEINNPLSAIAVCVQEIAESLAAPHNAGDESFDAEISENLDYINNEIHRCKRITTGLLNLARKSEHRRAPVDINHMLRNVVMLVKYKARREHKEIRLTLAADLPILQGEPDSLSQVFLNLIFNAIEFTPADSTIEVRSGKENKDLIFVEVIDQGFGIAPQNLDKIFKPFFTTKPLGYGTGLGLPISLRIVKHLGGRIEVESKLNKGTIFKVVLPIEEREGFAIEEEAKKATAS
jgi:signal transduction histidine kinase